MNALGSTVSSETQSLAPVRLRLLLSGGLRLLLPTADVLVGLFFAVFAHGLHDDAALMAVVYLIGFRWAGLHRSRLNPSLLEELPRLLAVLVGSTGVVLSARVLLGNTEPPSVFLHLVAFEALGVVLGRAAVYSVVRQARAARLVEHRTLLLGADEVGRELAQALLDNPEYGLLPIGFLEDDDPDVPGNRSADLSADGPAAALPMLGGAADLTRVALQERVDAIVVVFPQAPLPRLMQAMRDAGRLRAQVFVVPRLFEVHTQHYLGDSVRGIPLVRLHRSPLAGAPWAAKRLLDVAVSATALLLASPLLAVIAALVRWEGGPGVLFRQERIGRDGRPFDVLKFRSLKPVDDRESATRWNVAHDDRLGPIGKTLRATSLDELPQLWNILRGDMTLVGPRPERPYFVDKFSREHSDYASRHRMPAGLTGWAAVNGLRGDTSIKERARHDNYYIENWSLWLDISILLRTAGAVFRRSGS